jgi:anti-sigma regulatory factor (Ser/Thr protein kinase)
MKFQVAQIHFDENDFLVGFTDGTTDAKNISGTLFSEERLLRIIAAPWTSIFSMLFELNVELQKHIGVQAQFDDITLISLRRKSKLKQYPHTISRPARLDALRDLRSFVEAAAEYCDLRGEDIFSFKLAVDELCTNIIQYGYENQEPGVISLSFTVEGNQARLAIRDDGKYFSPDQAKSPDIEADWDVREEGGLGLYFVKELMDNVTYNRTKENMNQIIIEKELIGRSLHKE